MTVRPPAAFWRSRAWWNRAGRAALGLYIATGLAFLSTLIVARELGPHAFGTVVLALAIAGLFGTLLDLSLEEAVVHHGYRALARGDAAGVLGLIRASVILDIAIGIVVAASVVLLAAPLADLASAGRLDPGLVRLAALVTLASTADSTVSAVIQVAGRADLRAWGMAGANLARLAGVVVAVQAGTAEAVILAYAAGSAVGAIGQMLVAWTLVRRRWGGQGQTAVLRTPVRELVRFGAFTSITTTVAAANGALVPVVLGRLSGPTAVGLFRVAMLPVFVSDNASGPIRLVLYPEQARLAAEGDVHQIRQAVRTHTLAALALAVPVAVAAWFVLPWLVPAIYSDTFANAVHPARILLVAAVLRLATSWFKTLPAALGRPQLRTALVLVELAVMITLLVALGGRGSEGAAIAVSATSVVSAATAAIAVRLLLRRAEGSPAPRAAHGEVELSR
jgi:O-antigen/teichoic acid export membrane protein